MSIAISNINPEVLNFTEKLNQVLKANKLLQKKTKPKNFSEIKSVKPKTNKISYISNIYNNMNNNKKIIGQMENYYKIEKILEKSVTKLVKPKEEKSEINRPKKIVQVIPNTNRNEIEEIIEDNDGNHSIEELDSSSIPEIDLTKDNNDRKYRREQKELREQRVQIVQNDYQNVTEVNNMNNNIDINNNNDMFLNFLNNMNKTTNIHNINSYSDNLNVISSINAIEKPRKYMKKNNSYNTYNYQKMNKIKKLNTFQNDNISHGYISNHHIFRNNLKKKEKIKIKKKELTPEEIEKEYYDIINIQMSELDKYFLCLNFFLNNGFSDDVRYIYFENLLDIGLPINGNFEQFYENFISNCKEKYLDIPNKIICEIYFKFILKILVEKISESKKILVSNFFFDGIKFDFVRSNFDLIAYAKELIADNEFNLYNFMIGNYDLLFKDINIKINLGFNKFKSVIAKMLSNVIIKCDKSGYLNYRQYIDNEDIIFKGLKIKDNQFYTHSKYSIKTMICIKVFGEDLPDKKFNDIINQFFLHLFSHFNYSNFIQ